MSFTNGRTPVDAIAASEIVPGQPRPPHAVLSEAPRERTARGNAMKFLGGAVLFLLFLLGGRWFAIETDDSPILTYVSMDKPLSSVEKAVYFHPEAAKAGDTVQLFFNRTKWFDVRYKSANLHFNATCLMEIERDGKLVIEPTRRDFVSYPINVPPVAEEVPTKSRPFQVPAECLPGSLVYRAFARHHRGPFLSDKETRDFPEVFLTVVAR